MSLVELNSLFKEDPYNNPRERYLRALMDMYVEPTEVAHTPENGYLKGRKVNEVDRFQIVKMVQNTALALAGERPGILDSPKELIDALCEKGMSIKAIQFCLELPPRDIEDLKAGYRFPYYESAWKSVFGDLGEKLDSRGSDDDPNLLQSVLFCSRETRVNELRRLRKRAGRRFSQPEDLLRYLVDHGVPASVLARTVYTSPSVMTDILEGTRRLSNSGVEQVNYLFEEQFPPREKSKRGVYSRTGGDVPPA